MQLLLLNNDPLHTTLLNQDGHALYSISSSSLSGSSLNSPCPSPPCPGYRQQPSNAHLAFPIVRTDSTPHPDDHKYSQDRPSPHPSPVLDPLPPAKLSRSTPVFQPAALSTSIKRLRSYQSSTTNVEVKVGEIESMGHHGRTRVQLCNLGMEICTPPTTKMTEVPSLSPPDSQTTLSRTNVAGTALEAFREFCVQSQQKKVNTAPVVRSTSTTGSTAATDKALVPDQTWSFKGPDDRPYKWISLASNPVLVHDAQPPTPIACFRPAKLGIVSRSRRGFLEILPPGLNKEDWIVVTFVGYFRMKLGDRLSYYTPCSSHPEVQSLPIGMKMTTTMNHHDGNVALATSLKLISETSRLAMSSPQNPLSKLPQKASLPPAYIEALRRRNRNPIPRRTY